MIPSMRCSSPYLSFLLWEQSLKLKGHLRNNMYRPHASNSILIGREKACIESFSQKVAYHYCLGPLIACKRCQHNVPIEICCVILYRYWGHFCSLFWGALITFAEGTAGDRRDQTNGRQHHTLKRLRLLIFFVLFCGECPMLRRKSLLSWGFQFATVHSWWWVIPGTYFFKTKNEIAF